MRARRSARAHGAPRDEFRVERNVGVGCVTIVGGFFSGGMIGVLVAKVVGWITQCRAAPGLPACNWQAYMLVGAVLGVVTLPALVFWRFRRPRRGLVDAEQRF